MTLRKLMDKSEIFSFLFLLDDERSLSIEVSDDTTSLIIVICLCIQFHINWLKAIVCLPENNDAYKVLNIMTFSADDKELKLIAYYLSPFSFKIGVLTHCESTYKIWGIILENLAAVCLASPEKKRVEEYTSGIQQQCGAFLTASEQ
ncbi:hypothetical protein GQX74_011739 [Glossina fuscipes]|nr:hypothetical protein GQX74_011739 [Glossina fuscipes]